MAGMCQVWKVDERMIGPDGVRKKDASKVDAPMHNSNYSDTYYQIDKFNQIEARYVLRKQGSKKHGWHPNCCFDSSI